MPSLTFSRRLLQPGLPRFVFSVLLLFFSAVAAHAQDGAVDPDFDVVISERNLASPPYAVTSIFPQRDGKILVGGFFPFLGGKGRVNLARLNADGTADPSFNARLPESFEVHQVIPDSQGRVLLLASQSPIQGIPRPGFARLKANGDLDASFLPPSGVQGFTLDQLGRILVWGISISDGNTRRRGLARLNPDGSIDPGFIPALNPEDSVRKAAFDPLGRIVIFGDLKKTDGNVSPGLIRLNADGSIDSGFTSGISLRVRSVSNSGGAFGLDPFGRILVSDEFTPTQKLVRLNLNGSVDTGFNPPTGVGARFVFTPSGKIIAANHQNFFFLTSSLVRLNQDGTPDASYVSPMFFTGRITLSVDSTGRVLYGGNSIQDTTNQLTLSLGRLNENGSRDETFRTDDLKQGVVHSVVTDPGGRVLVGGFFDSCGAFPIPTLARVNGNGTVDTTFRPFPSINGTAPSNNTVRAIALDSSNRVLVYGSFTSIGGGARTNLARLNPDGTLDTTFNAGAAPPASFQTKIVVTPSGKIYVNGGFTQFNGFNRPRLVRLNSDGSVDTGFQPVDTGLPADSVFPFALDSAGKIIVRGANGLARLNQDGSLDSTFNVSFASDPFGTFNLFVVENDRILVGLGLNGTPRNRLFRLNADGSPDSSFSSSLPPNDSLFLTAVASNGKILIERAGQTLEILRLNADGTIDPTFHASKVEGGNFFVNTIAFDGNGRTLVAGDFRRIDNIPRVGVCRLITDQCLDEVSPTELSIPATGGTGTLNFSVPGSTCPRRVESAYPWISVLSSGNGSATVAYSIAPNTGQQRTGFIRVNNRLVTVTQQGDCSDLCACPTITNSTVTFQDTGGQGTATFTLPNTCTWEAGTDVSWILITSPVQGQGSGTIQYRVFPNYGSGRNGRITVGNVVITVTQSSRRVPTPGSYRASNGFVYLRNSNTTGIADAEFFYGQPGDIPLSGDWDGDGGESVGIYRGGVFYLRNSNTGGFADIQFPYGQPGDIPIAGDWDGDGIDTVGVIRGNRILLRNSNSAGPADIDFNYGLDTDTFIVGDWNGDGIDTIGAFRTTNGFVYLRNANTTGNADVQFFYGQAGDRPVAGDWDGDGIDTIGVVRDNRWLLRNSNTSGFADIDFNYGDPNDIPIVGDWNGTP